MAFNVDDMDEITIDGEKFRGIGYQGLLTTNTKTYVEEPTRSNSGAIENINDHDTFFVPRVKVNFKLFKIEDYERLCRVVSASNEYTVRYFDKQIGDFVMHKMYCEPEEMYKLFNVGFNVIGVLDYTISFVGTLNDIDDYAVTYYLNASIGDSSILSTTNYKWGGSMVTMTGEELEEIAEEKSFVLPTGTFKGWNTRSDNSGMNYYPNKRETVFSNLNLYAKWGYTLSFDSAGGSSVDSIDVIADAKIGTLPVPTKANYKFAGWTIDGEDITRDTIYTYGQNKTAVVNWIPISGLYRDGELVMSWQEIKSTYPSAFVTSGHIVGNGYLSYLTDLDGDLVIDDEITQIDDYAFTACWNLASIDLPDNITSIGDSAFESCTNLASIDLPDNITSIGDSAFKGCTNLVSIDLPNNITSIGDSTFEGCTNLASIDLPDNITSIGKDAFVRCVNLSSIDFPNNLITIDDYAFCICTSLVSVNLPNGLISIGYGTFSNCTSLVSVNLPNSLTKIDIAGFSDCTSLVSVNLPSSLTTIEGFSFSNCTSLLTANIYTTSITPKIAGATNGIFRGCGSSLVIHASSTLNETTAKTAFGQYWNYDSNSKSYFTTIYDL